MMRGEVYPDKVSIVNEATILSAMFAQPLLQNQAHVSVDNNTSIELTSVVSDRTHCSDYDDDMDLTDQSSLIQVYPGFQKSDYRIGYAIENDLSAAPIVMPTMWTCVKNVFGMSHL
jgi:hypothetical protein